MGRTSYVAVAAMLAAIAMAGCADESGGTDTGGDGPDVGATSTTGGIRGVVVDQGIVPIVDATVIVLNTDLSTTTDENGEFVFSGMDPGSYFIEASHPLYDKQQTSSEVVAGVDKPKAVKLQLTRLISQEPYMVTMPFEGYITCSANAAGIQSEECGEGVGVEGVGRVGGNPNNRAQIDFFVDNTDVKGFVIEQRWDPSITIGVGGNGDFRTVFALDWACEPVCRGDRLASATSGSPLYMQVRDTEESQPIGKRAADGKFDETTPFSTFTWASEEESGMLLEQPFELYVSVGYHLPLPEDWSFVNGDETPF